ncbi:MAG: UDP-N-acetylmuramoyl-L-alanyl-D-glutamate--2,6-diaminopimelate ligase [bacterium]|nr:UDP-N-acetylmuramoyl-L-alanyl-D-glutamate--2,6-diaminopimelate ligase [bacterium]
MSIKNDLAKTARQMLPNGAVKLLENNYRKSRAKLVSAQFGNPAKKLRVIAATGTNGKTTTINFLNEILKEAGYKTAMFSTANIEIAGEKMVNDTNSTTATVARLQKFFRQAVKNDVEFALVEATSHALEQYKFAGIDFEMAIMTNLTQDHLDYHKTMENYARAKARLFATEPKFIVLNADDEWFDYYNKFNAGDQKITYGTKENADVRITSATLYKKGSEAKIIIDNNVELEAATNLPGKFNIFNMTAAISAAYLLGISLEDIQNGVANLENIAGRFERAVENLPFEVIVDYAHTPDGLEKLLEAAKNITKGRTILVFGACGDRDRAKRPLMGKIAKDLADRIILTDEENYTEDSEQIRAEIKAGMGEKLPAHVQEIADRRVAIKKAFQIASKGDTILITGLGHEVYRIIDGEKVPWNDSEVAREIAQEMFKK